MIQLKVVHVIDRYPRPTYLGKRDLLCVAEHHVCCVGGPRAVLPHQTSQHERVEHNQEDERDDPHEDQVHPDAVNLKESERGWVSEQEISELYVCAGKGFNCEHDSFGYVRKMVESAQEHHLFLHLGPFSLFDDAALSAL